MLEIRLDNCFWNSLYYFFRQLWSPNAVSGGIGRGMHVAYIHKYTGEQKSFAKFCHLHWYIYESGPQSTKSKCLEKSPEGWKIALQEIKVA